jgi:predicted acyltransferase
MAGLGAAAAGALIGVGVSLVLPASHKLEAAAVSVLAAGCAVLAFAAVAYVLDDADVRPALARIAKAVRPGVAG